MGIIKWEPAKPFKYRDNLISSAVAAKGEVAFTPSYEKEPRENIKFIISNEYQRMWFRERDEAAKHAHQLKTKKDPSSVVFVRRRFVQKLFLHKVDPKNKRDKAQQQRFIMKKFQNIPARTDNQPSDKPAKNLIGETSLAQKQMQKVQDKITQQYVRYKPDCGKKGKQWSPFVDKEAAKTKVTEVDPHLSKSDQECCKACDNCC